MNFLDVGSYETKTDVEIKKIHKECAASDDLFGDSPPLCEQVRRRHAEYNFIGTHNNVPHTP